MFLKKSRSAGETSSPGFRAAPRPFAAPVRRSPAAPLASPTAVGAPSVQRMPLYWHGKEIRLPEKEDDPNRIVETLDLDRERRDELRAALEGKNNKLLREIETDWRKARPTYDPLFAIAAELTPLEDHVKGKAELDREQTEALAAILSRLTRAQRGLIDFKSEEQTAAQGLRDTIGGLRIRAEALWKQSKFTKDVKIAAPAGGGLGIDAADITNAEVEAYRDDLRQMGVWGGLAEAEQGARILAITADIFTVGADGNYRRIIQVGHGAGGQGRALLHRGNHYEVVQGAVAGQPFSEDHIVEDTEADGNCLFEGLLIVRSGVKLGQKARVRSVQGLRNAIADQLDADSQIRPSLLQILALGEEGGLGPKTRKYARARSQPPAQIRKQLAARGVAEATYGVDLAAYENAWKKDPLSKETLRFYDALRAHLGATVGTGKHGVRGAFLPGSPPEGVFPLEVWDRNKVGLKFEVHAQFDPERVEGEGSKYYIGEYRQLIRGYFKDKTGVRDHTLAKGLKLSPSLDREDANGTVPPYGHRDTARAHDKFVTLSGNRGVYTAKDSPSLPVFDDEVVEIQLVFTGQLVEVEVDGSKRTDGTVFAERTWTVQGKAAKVRGKVEVIGLDDALPQGWPGWKPTAASSSGGSKGKSGSGAKKGGKKGK